MAAFDELTSELGCELRRVIPIPEEELRGSFPSWIDGDGQFVSEICLADGEKSQVVS